MIEIPVGHPCGRLSRSTLSVCLLIFALFALTKISVVSGEDGSLSNGLGDNYDWVTLSDGYEIAKEQRKPLMLIIHKSWCGACKCNARMTFLKV